MKKGFLFPGCKLPSTCRLRFTFLPFFLLFLWFGCGTSRQVSNRNISYIYKRDETFLLPQYRIVHIDDSNSVLYYKINSEDLLFTKQGENEYSSKFRISWVMIQNYESKEILDSGYVVKEEKINGVTEKVFYGTLAFKSRPAKSYVMEVRMHDLNRNQRNIQFLVVDRSSPNERQNFYFSTRDDGAAPHFTYTLAPGTQLTLTHRKKPAKYFVRYYNREFPLPPPPFSYFNPKGFDFKPDSLFVLITENDSVRFAPPKKGFYHVQTDTSVTEGLTIYCFSENFPKLKTHEGMIVPLRYITSKTEYERMMSYSNKKLAVDSFWLAGAGSPERGKELIRKFYNRLHDANFYFTSISEGWRTDRGLIYLIYGPPNVIYRNTNAETWMYGEENNVNSLSFTFIKVINPFSENDFRLDRSPSFQDSWYRAANVWREGRVFLDN